MTVPRRGEGFRPARQAWDGCFRTGGLAEFAQAGLLEKNPKPEVRKPNTAMPCDPAGKQRDLTLLSRLQEPT